jgi:membrane protease YdiL (CAAX protease family)
LASDEGWPATPTPEPGGMRASRTRSVAERILLGPNGVRAGWRLLVFIFLFLAVTQMVGIAAKHLPAVSAVFRAGFAGQLRPSFLFVAETLMLIPVLVASGVMGIVEGRSFGDYGLPARGALGPLFWQGLAWGLAEITLLVLGIWAFGGFSFGGLALRGESLLKYGALWAVGFALVGIYEEFAFRGYAQFTLASGIGFWPAATVLSAAFGAVHLRNPGEGWVGALSVFAIGMFFCFTLRRTGHLWFAIGMHASFDWGETFLYSVPNSGVTATGHLLNSSLHGPAWLTGGTVGPEGSVVCFPIIGVLFVAFHALYPPRRKEPEYETIPSMKAIQHENDHR